MCNYEFSCIHTVVASCCVTGRDLFYITLYCVTHHKVTLCIASDDAICKYRNTAICHAVSSTHYKSSYIQLLLRIKECSKTFWSPGHAFRTELASPRYDTLRSRLSPVRTCCTVSATIPFWSRLYTTKDAKFVFIKPLFPWQRNFCVLQQVSQ